MADVKKLVEGKYLMYQGKPLVREENTIIYGDLNNDPCVLVLEIMSYTGEGEDKVPNVILMQLVDSKDPNKIIKQGQKQGLHAAFELGLIWLDVELKKSAQ
jgi:hypothetical protein